jgi:ribosomal protein S18 acetylase RimI-like enzyme
MPSGGRGLVPDDDDDPEDGSDSLFHVIWDSERKEYARDARLCVDGLMELGVSSHKILPIVEWVALSLFDTELPTYTYKGKETTLWPKPTLTKSMSAELDVWADVRLVFLLIAVSREARALGLDPVLQRHDGMQWDGMTSKHEAFFGATLLLGKYGTCCATLTAMVEETATAKGEAIEQIYRRLREMLARMISVGIELPNIMMTPEKQSLQDVVHAVSKDTSIALFIDDEVRITQDLFEAFADLVEANVSEFLTRRQRSAAAKQRRSAEVVEELSKPGTKILAVFNTSRQDARPADHVAGFIAWRNDVQEEGFLKCIAYTLYLHLTPLFRDNKIGKTLIAYAEDDALESSEAGAVTMLLTVLKKNKRAQGFYKHLDYDPSATSPDDGDYIVSCPRFCAPARRNLLLLTIGRSILDRSSACRLRLRCHRPAHHRHRQPPHRHPCRRLCRRRSARHRHHHPHPPPSPPPPLPPSTPPTLP